MGDFEKKFPTSACRKKKIACNTKVIEKNYCPAEKNILSTRLLEKRVKWSALNKHFSGREISLQVFFSYCRRQSHVDNCFNKVQKLWIIIGFERNLALTDGHIRQSM